MTLAVDLQNVTITQECGRDVFNGLSERYSAEHILIISSRGFTKRGVTARLVSEFNNRQITVFDQVSINPERSDIANCLAMLGNNNIQLILAVGGGSVIDCAKIVRAELGSPTQPKLLAIPTTAGSGAEVTPFATLWDSRKQIKQSITVPKPDDVLLCPALTVSCPRDITLYCALDALSHALESLWNNNRTTESERLALASIDKLVSFLPRVLSDGDNVEARKHIQLAATLSGAAIAITKTAIAHAISYPLTMRYGVPHGLASSCTLMAILQSYPAKQLKIPPELAAATLDLLAKLNLRCELSHYLDHNTIANDEDFDLDPSRAKNFVCAIGPSDIERILSQSI